MGKLVLVIMYMNWVFKYSGMYQLQSLEGLERQQKALVWPPMPCFYLCDVDGIFIAASLSSRA